MTIYKTEEELNNKLIKPITFFRPIVSDDGKIIKNLAITDNCELYDYDEMLEGKYMVDLEPKVIPKVDKNGRLYANVSQENGKYQHLARVMLIAFDDDRKPLSYYKQYQADHVDPSVPLDNSLENIQWVLPAENMRRAGETGVMIKKYHKPFVHKICQMICDGYSRQEIMKDLNINGQLIDDIRSGRSHKSVSCQYLDKGFEYKYFNKDERREYAHKICQLYVEGYRKSEIEKMIPDLPCKSLVRNVIEKRSYLDVSSQYDF